MNENARRPEIEQQRLMWNEWNQIREESQHDDSLRQARLIEGWLQAIDRTDLNILDVGCGAGWMEEWLVRFGRVTATDLADEILARARLRQPEVTFIAGDFSTLEFRKASFDVVVSLEVLSHVADQVAFINKCAELLQPGGWLMLATQNRPVLERLNDVPPPKPGQLRRWVDEAELRDLLEPRFVVEEIRSVTLKSNKRHPIRLLTSNRVERSLGPFAGPILDPLRARLERRGYGWTLMAKAYRRGETQP